jgi:hypothetical protein
MQKLLNELSEMKKKKIDINIINSLTMIVDNIITENLNGTKYFYIYNTELIVYKFPKFDNDIIFKMISKFVENIGLRYNIVNSDCICIRWDN